MRKTIVIGIAIIVLATISACKLEFGQRVTCTLAAPVPCSSTTVTDIDDNSYTTVKIGNQCWLKENLKTAHYSNGSAIAQIEDSTIWNADSITTPAWCYYNFNVANNPTYGKLYDWYAITDTNKLCPVGWHVPTDSEWLQLFNYLSVTCDSFLFDSSGLSILLPGGNGYSLYWSATPDNSSNFGNTFGDSSHLAIKYQINPVNTAIPYYRTPGPKGIPCLVRCVGD